MATLHGAANTGPKDRVSSEFSGDRSRGLKSIAAGGGILSALAASSCCAIPLALFMAGVGGAWIGNLTVLAPYQPVFLAVALGFIATGFVLVYRKPKAACAEDAACATPHSDRLTKMGLWIAAGLVVLALLFPYTAPWLLNT